MRCGLCGITNQKSEAKSGCRKIKLNIGWSYLCKYCYGQGFEFWSWSSQSRSCFYVYAREIGV